MPVSSLGIFWPTLKRVIECYPNSVLDVGCGTGRVGFAVRNYVEEICPPQVHPCKKEGWLLSLEGVEIEPSYLNPVHDYVYDKVWLMGAEEFFEQNTREWDVVLCLDVIEHFPLERARALVCEMYKRTGRFLIIGAPYGEHPQEEWFGNPHERHHFAVTEEFFRGLPVEQLWLTDGSILAVIGAHQDAKPPPKELVIENILSRLGR